MAAPVITERFYFGLLVSFPVMAAQFVSIISTLVTLNVWSADELLDWALFEALLDCCDP